MSSATTITTPTTAAMTRMATMDMAAAYVVPEQGFEP
jgi:hypothetical protein